MSNLEARMAALNAAANRSVATSGTCIAAALAAMENRIGKVTFTPSQSDPRYNWFAQAYQSLKKDLSLFRHGVGAEIDADAGLGSDGLKAANAVLERAKAKKRLDDAGPKSAYIAAFCTYQGKFEGGVEIMSADAFASHGVIGAAISADDNKIEFYEKDGLVVAIIKDSNGDSVMLYNAAAPTMLEEFTNGVNGAALMNLIRASWNPIKRAGVAFPKSTFDVEPDVSYFVDNKFTVGGVDGTWVQAIKQAKFAMDHLGYKAEVVFAAAAVLESMSFEPDLSDYLVFPGNTPLAVILHRPGAVHAHFGAIVSPNDFVKK